MPLYQGSVASQVPRPPGFVLKRHPSMPLLTKVRWHSECPPPGLVLLLHTCPHGCHIPPSRRRAHIAYMGPLYFSSNVTPMLEALKGLRLNIHAPPAIGKRKLAKTGGCATNVGQRSLTGEESRSVGDAGGWRRGLSTSRTGNASAKRNGRRRPGKRTRRWRGGRGRSWRVRAVRDVCGRRAGSTTRRLARPAGPEASCARVDGLQERRRPAHGILGLCWSVDGANPVLWLRCACLGGWFDDYWDDDGVAKLAA